MNIDENSNMLSDETCADNSFEAAFLAGTAPTMTCDHPAERRSLIQKIFGK